ncbi:hypothetical protein O181_066920 [Austropuccinia psidii MF-1]|uniref:Uncharacterized protein n=1 Tax=Austropuccinia psidii MF-1 TaxID=1389203 RepID=A0A9Q3EPU9_9BASI|nr:hypothetical protein [Austropuccinia psidii MF-1]
MPNKSSPHSRNSAKHPRKRSRKLSEGSDTSPSKPSTHIRFPSDDQPAEENTQLEEIDGQAEGSDQGDRLEAEPEPVLSFQDEELCYPDSDEAPEVVSITTSKRELKEKEAALNEFTKAAALARRKKNRIRDEKLKENSKKRKSVMKAETELESEEPPSENENSSEPVPLTDQSSRKKYLDPSIFASASQILNQSKQLSQARELENQKILAMKQKKRKKLLQPHDRRDIGNNVTVVHLSKTDHLNPAPPPTSVLNFARNRLYTKPNRSATRLPKATLAAKAELGCRKLIPTVSSRKAHKPAAVFVRPQK